MEVSLAVDPLIVKDIHRQLLARNATEVRAFSGITSDYQLCLRQLRDLRVRLAALALPYVVSSVNFIT